jgi:hypothetical protein
MKKIAAPFALLFVLVVSVAIAVKGNETETKSTMLSHLKTGQQVKLTRSESYSFNFVLEADRSDRQKKLAEMQEDPSNVRPWTITEIGSDYVVISNPNGLEQTISASAIHIITKATDEKPAAEPDQKK